MNQQDAQNSVIRLYFPLVHLQDQPFISCTSHLVYAGTSGIYEMRCTAYKVAPDDGLIQPETRRASNGK